MPGGICDDWKHGLWNSQLASYDTLENLLKNSEPIYTYIKWELNLFQPVVVSIKSVSWMPGSYEW